MRLVKDIGYFGHNENEIGVFRILILLKTNGILF